MHQRFLLFAMLAFTGFILSCSGNSGPAQPDTHPPLEDNIYNFVQTGPNTMLLGAWEIYIDVTQETITALPLRTADMHWNVTPMVTPPKCYDCFLAKNLSYDPDTKIVTVDVGFRNPSGITGRDVRGIITVFGDKELLNPDGYTDLFWPIPGQWSPFIAFDTGIGQREFPGLIDQYETIQIYNPHFPSFVPITYIVEASWPVNCQEPYEVKFAGVTGNLFSDGSNAPILQVYARDWQDNVKCVNIDLDPVGGGVVNLEPSGTLPDVWQTPVSCAPGTIPGDYKLVVCATTNAPFDQTASMYNYVKLTVTEPPNPEAEVFGIPERITNTPGQSWIWPRHAIAVTSDGTSHVVWVDNTTNPEIWHVFYSFRGSGGWSTPLQIDDSTGQAIYATIAADADDTLHIVWEDSRNHVLGSDVFYSSSSDTFGSENIIVDGTDGFRHVHPRIAAGSDNTLHMAWHSKELIDYDEYEYDLWYCDRPGGSAIWDGASSIVSGEDVVEAWPAIAPGPSGSAYIAYQSDESSLNSIYFTDNTLGTFSAPTVVTTTDAYQPAIDVASDGSIVVSYFDGIDGTFTDIYARFSLDGGDSWGSPMVVSENDEYYQYAPDVECTPEGDLHFAWHEEDNTGRPRRVLYREYLNGIGWQDTIELVDSYGMGLWPSMDSDSDGRIHVVYQLYTPLCLPLRTITKSGTATVFLDIPCLSLSY